LVIRRLLTCVTNPSAYEGIAISRRVKQAPIHPGLRE
jgi:hypothetical protein